MKTSFLICFFLLLMMIFLSSCKEEPSPVEPLINTENCLLLEDAKEQILANDIQEHLIILSISENTEGQVSVLYDNGTSIEICQSQLKAYNLSIESWNVEFTWADGSESNAVLRGGNIALIIEDHPYAPLAVSLALELPTSASVEIQVIGQDGAESSINKNFELNRNAQSLPILGLYPDTENSILVNILSISGYSLYTELLYVERGPVPESFPEIEVLVLNTEAMNPGFTLVSYRSSFSPNIPFMLDPWGKIRWYLDYTDHPELGLLHYDVGIERLENGNFYFGNRNASIVYEVGITGEIMNSWPIGAYSIHHHTLEKYNGNFLITASDPNSFHENGLPAIDDHLLELDRNTGLVTQAWDLKNIIDEHRVALRDETQNNPVDWAHVNSVWYDESDNSIIASVLNQGIIKFDYSGQIKWILSNHTGWGENRLGEDLNDFLLTAIDQAGQVYNDSIQLGYVNDDTFEWPWFQHAAKLSEKGTLTVFDNGYKRNFESLPGGYSRAVEYEIDEENMTVKQIWSYGKERAWETFSACCSDVDFLSQSDNVLFGPGDTRIAPGSTDYTSRIVEVDYITKNVVWELFMDSPWIGYHRIERMNIYP